ncbi:MAG: hypothetical protein EBU33_07665 [Sphingobacteriia bacterium]|nr:hypothetical protein [Sphingobacteriia bacterium]
MKQELDEALCAKYPLVFKDRHADMRTTAMCWGLDCGDGWYNIIDVLCQTMTWKYRQAESAYNSIKDKVGKPRWEGGKHIVTQEEIDAAKAKMEEEALKVPVASQVKEKFGGLRFYVSGATDEHYNYISFAESISYRTCEQCGAAGKTYTDGWHRTLCDIHAEMDGRTEEYKYEENE